MGVPNQLSNELQTAALHVRGATKTANGPGQFHFQFYAAPSLNDPAFPGAQGNPEEFLYRMIPNYDEYYRILSALKGTMEGKVVLSIRTCGETFGDKTTPIGTNNNVSWMSVNPFGGNKEIQELT